MQIYIKELGKMASFSLLQIVYIIVALLFFIQSNYVYSVLTLLLALPFTLWTYKIYKISKNKMQLNME